MKRNSADATKRNESEVRNAGGEGENRAPHPNPTVPQHRDSGGEAAVLGLVVRCSGGDAFFVGRLSRPSALPDGLAMPSYVTIQLQPITRQSGGAGLAWTPGGQGADDARAHRSTWRTLSVLV